MAYRRHGGFLLGVVQVIAWILVLSAFGITLSDIINLNWLDGMAELLINFFTL